MVILLLFQPVSVCTGELLLLLDSNLGNPERNSGTFKSPLFLPIAMFTPPKPILHVSLDFGTDFQIWSAQR